MNNVYGTVRPSLINPSTDVDIFYYYRPTRNSEDTVSYNGKWKKIDNPSDVLSVAQVEDGARLGASVDNRLPGIYNLKLPVSIFGRTGIYTLWIRPKEVLCTIKTVGALSVYPDIRGIVIDLNTLSSSMDRGIFEQDNLIGYRVDYLENGGSGLERKDYFRIVTSNNNCEAVSQNQTSGNTNLDGFRFNSAGTLSFLTVTPSTSPSFKANSKPFIGVANQKIILSNTKFDPFFIEVTMTDHDEETISYMLEGEQVRNYENGRLTTYNFQGEIYKQFEFSTIKDSYHGTPVAEIKVDKTNSNNVDTSLDLDELKNSDSN